MLQIETEPDKEFGFFSSPALIRAAQVNVDIMRVAGVRTMFRMAHGSVPRGPQAIGAGSAPGVQRFRERFTQSSLMRAPFADFGSEPAPKTYDTPRGTGASGFVRHHFPLPAGGQLVEVSSPRRQIAPLTSSRKPFDGAESESLEAFGTAQSGSIIGETNLGLGEIPAGSASADKRSQSVPANGEVFIDGTALARFIKDYFNTETEIQRSGVLGINPRVSAPWNSPSLAS
jgi:hypothetical protein